MIDQGDPGVRDGADPTERAIELLRRAAHNAGGEAGAEYTAAADALAGDKVEVCVPCSGAEGETREAGNGGERYRSGAEEHRQ